MPVTTGVLGRAWRAEVTRWGAVVPWDGTPGLDWYVAADDRWHVPADEAAVRQRRIAGTAVTETRVRVPHGDAVQRVYSVADHGGLTVVEVDNDSPSPIAVAFDRRDVRTERPVADVPIDGIELPSGSFVMPVGHRSRVRVALAHDGSGAGALPATVPDAEQTVRGWSAVLDRAGRLELPGATATWDELVRAERCELLLGSMAHAADDPAAFALGLGELVRLGEDPDAWLPELAEAVAAMAPAVGWDGDVGLRAAARVLHAAGERRALTDLHRIVSRRRASTAPAGAPSGVRSVPWYEEQLACDGTLLPGGFASDWLGAGLEVHGLPIGTAATVSFAVRWHGARPAVLWEVTGERVPMSAPVVAPGWSTAERSGEALWPAPPGAQAVADGDAPSFS